MIVHGPVDNSSSPGRMDPMVVGRGQMYLCVMVSWFVVAGAAAGQAPKLSFLRELAMPAESETDQLAFSPDGKRIAVGMYAGPIRVYEVATAKTVAVLDPNKVREGLRGSDQLAFTPDGSTLCSVCGCSSTDWCV